MCIALELAPMGSLFGILDKKLEAIKAAQADLPTANIKMPGGVLGHEISARIALQVSKREREREYHYLCLYCSAHCVLMRMLLRAFVSYTSTSSVLMYVAGSSCILCMIVFSNRLVLYN